MFVPFCVSIAMFTAVYLYMSRTFNGRAIKAVAQDRLALQLMGADPVKIKQLGFGISIGTAALAGALLIIIIPVEPSVGRLYIGQVFAIAVLAGLGSIPGTLVAGLVLGVAESLVSTFFGAPPGRPPWPSAFCSRPSPSGRRGCSADENACGEALRLLDLRRSHRADRRRSNDLRRVRHQQVHLFRGLCRPAIRDSRDRLEHHGRLHGVCEFRHRGVLCGGRIQLRRPLQPVRSALGADDSLLGRGLCVARSRHGLPDAPAAGRLLRHRDARHGHRPRDLDD